MHEQLKLNEAKYFYSRMVAETNSRENFLYDLSAFLSSARSVLQYALKEAEMKSGGKAWYDREMASSAVLTFFKDKRDINVHEAPLEVNRRTSVEMTAVARISSSLHVRAFDKDGNLIGERISASPAPAPSPSPPPVITHTFTFPNWTGTENLIQLCQIYLNELDRIITEGQRKNFLTS